MPKRTTRPAGGYFPGDIFRMYFPDLRRGVWRSLVAHVVWDHVVAGSNPVTPTTFLIVRLSNRIIHTPLAQLDRATDF